MSTTTAAASRGGRPAPPRPRRKPSILVVRASYDYTANSEAELSFSEGDTLYIVEKEGEWWKARKDGEEGYVPASYVAAHTAPINHPVHEACKRGNADFLRELLAQGASVNELDFASNVPLHWACRSGKDECVALLLEKNPVVDQANNIGDTPLHSAAWGGHANCAEQLLNHAHANHSPTFVLEMLTARNRAGETPSDVTRGVEVKAVLQRWERIATQESGGKGISASFEALAGESDDEGDD
ncbi:ankyrin [Gonapodya prolifera JEL478]|uniref:Osteoclast-stimulating factor 1 n=1 Tax=Gonapodya prolifera (strain JEL478) TaxID=1344416 RepID=A0A139A381_GONPJ|nr:ankyrin [Gonapodya prolifera JEL478]|eukprot:KXS11276.1 ankyrin [Gonapodya prolifera JEL478]